MSETLTATWCISLDTRCPNCHHDFDIVNDLDDFGDRGIKPLETRTAKAENVEVQCPACVHEFSVTLDY
jgi:ribosomal protein S27E